MLNRLRSGNVAGLGEFFAIATTALWILEIKPASALIVVLTLASLALTGQRITEWSGAKESGLGLGLVVGCSVYTIFAQALLIAGISPSLSHWVAIGLPLGLVIFASRVQTENHFLDSPVVDFLPLSALSIGILVVALRHTWLMPFALGVASYGRMRGSEFQGTPWRIFSISSTVLGAATSNLLRPDQWWYFYQGNDAQFFESLSWSIARWSVLEHPGLSGGSISGYHWLTYAFFGGLSELAQLQPWDGLLKIGILVTPTSLALLILESKSRNERSSPVSQGLLVLIVVAATPSNRVDSFTFSILISFAFLIFSGMEFDKRPKLLRIALFVLLSVALILAKVSTAAVVGSILTVTFVSQMRRRAISLIPTLSLAGVFVVLYLWLFRHTGAQTFLSAQLNIRAIPSKMLGLLNNSSLGIHLLIWIVLLKNVGKREILRLSPIAFATLGVALFALPIHIAFVGPSTSYFGLPAVYLFSLCAIRERRESQVVINWRKNRLMLPLALLGATAAGFGILGTANRIDSRFQVTELFGAWLLDIVTGLGLTSPGNQMHSRFELTELFGAWLLDTVTGSGLTLSIIALFLLTTARFGVRNPLLPALAVVAGLGVFSGQLMSNYRQVATRGTGVYTTSGENAAAFGSKGLDEVSRYVDMTTPKDTVLASNNFCCFGEAWFPHDVETRVRGVATIREIRETDLGGANYLLPANTRRRFLVQGLRFQTGSRPPSQDQADRVRLSLSFANSPTQQDINELRQYGVSGFIVNLALTSRRDWSEFAVERYRRDDFVYLELK